MKNLRVLSIVRHKSDQNIDDTYSTKLIFFFVVIQETKMKVRETNNISDKAFTLGMNSYYHTLRSEEFERFKNVRDTKKICFKRINQKGN